MRTFEFQDGKSSKFWNIALQRSSFTVTFGRIGTTGQTQIKAFPDEAKARKEHDKLVAEKLGKGYRETTSATPAAPPAPPSPPVPAPPPPRKAAAEPTPPPAPAAPPPSVPAPSGEQRTFTFSDATSHKFWNIQWQGSGFTITYGRQGSAGQTQVKTFPDEAKARKEHDKLIAEKLGKGYRETTPTATPAASSLREALERSLVENPDDLASHMAFADYLADQGDPLGDFIRVQLALEDPTRPPEERKKLQSQEKALRKAHEATWLGDLAPFLLDPTPKKDRDWRDMVTTHTWSRGWLDVLEVNRYGVEFMRVLARSPQTRLLRRLALEDNRYEEPSEYAPGDDLPEGAVYPQLYPLIRSPYLTNVRVFHLGEKITPEEETHAADGMFNCHTEGEGAAGIVKLMPRLEELYLHAHAVDTEQIFSLKTIPNLRILHVYHNNSYPLARLAKNPALGNLTRLVCHPHAMDDEEAYIRLPAVRALVRSPELKSLSHLAIRLCDMGDKGVKEIIDSGILKRLRVLDLRHGCITDKGARLLASCPDLKNLEALDLTNNSLTDDGIALLQATGVKLMANSQWRLSGDNFDDQQYLFAGDIE